MTPDTLQKATGSTAANAAKFADALTVAMAEFGIDTPARQAAFLAQVGHESARLQYVSELASGNAYNGRGDLGNTKSDAFKWAGGALPGPYFKGHGLIQITGFDNHAACGFALYPQDPTIFLRNPLALCLPGDAARSAGWYWRENGLNRWADSGDFDGVSDLINRGHKTTAVGDSNGYADRLALWNKAKAVLAAVPA